MVTTLWSLCMSKVPKPLALYSFYNVNPVPVRLRFMPLRFYLTKSMSTLPFAMFSRKLTLTVDDFTLLSNKPVRMPLPEGKRQLFEAL
jgi:hypothetical protein